MRVNFRNFHSVKCERLVFPQTQNALGTSKDYLFKNLNLEIQRNKHTVLTGFNGSGKSTLLGLVSGVFYPTNGSIIIDTKRVSYVSATPFILNSTLKENILYGNDKDINHKDIIKLIKDLNIFEKI